MPSVIPVPKRARAINEAQHPKFSRPRGHLGAGPGVSENGSDVGVLRGRHYCGFVKPVEDLPLTCHNVNGEESSKAASLIILTPLRGEVLCARVKLRTVSHLGITLPMA